MATTALRGSTVTTSGELPPVGSPAPTFRLTGGDLGTISSDDFAGKNVVLNIFPSIDTPTCQASVRAFNQRLADAPDTVVVCASADLPFAATRFCGAEGIENVVTGSTFRNPEFADDYGVRMVDGPLERLTARAVVIIDGEGTVVHTQLVDEIADEPDYDAALGSLS